MRERRKKERKKRNEVERKKEKQDSIDRAEKQEDRKIVGRNDDRKKGEEGLVGDWSSENRGERGKGGENEGQEGN